MYLTIFDAAGRTRTTALPEDAGDRPLLIGSRADCSIRVTGRGISPRHCALFSHGGMWLVQDLGSNSGTFLNEDRIRQPAMFGVGDVITLGRGETAVTITVASDASVSWHAVSPSSVAPVTAEPLAEVEAPPAPAAGPMSSEPSLRRTYKTKGQKLAPDVVLAGALGMVALLIIGGIIISFAVRTSREPIVVGQPAPETGTSAPPTTAPRVIVRPAPPRELTAAQAAAQQRRAQLEALRQDPAWQRVEEAHRIDPPPQAILVFDEYRASHPNSPLAQQLDAYTADALDRVWWQRARQLQQERARAASALEEVDAQLQPNPTPQQQQRADQLRKTLAQKQSELEQMQLESAEAIDPYDETQLAELREARDRQVYERWTQRVLESIRNTRGSLPW